MPVKELPAKRRLFCQEYLVDLCGRQAAIRAGYSPKTAEQQASNLLKDPLVAAEIERLKALRAEAVGIDAAWVLKRLAAEVDADVADLLDENGHVRPVQDWPLIWRQGLVSGMDVTVEFETVDGKKERTGTVTKLRFSDRIRRLELIGKHVDVSAFMERLKFDNADELAKAIEEGRRRALEAE